LIDRDEKNNDEEFLKMFHAPFNYSNSLIMILKHHDTYSKDGLKQRKHLSVELHLVVLKFLF
jgi:hypothetical protein